MSVSQFSHSVMSNSLPPHGLQHARLPCPSPTPRACSNSCPSNRWCHPNISSSAIPFSSCLQSFPALGSFQMSQASHQVARVLQIQLQHQSFQWTPRTDLLLLFKMLSRLVITVLPRSQFFASGGQNIGVSASASVLSMNIQDWSPLGWTGWISLQSKGLSRVFSNTTVQKHQFFGTQLSSQSNSHIHTWLLEKP